MPGVLLYKLMNNLPTVSYYWLEGTHTKKLFKKRANELGLNHRIINNRFSSVIRLDDSDFANINTDLAVTLRVNRRYSGHEAFCHIFDTSTAIENIRQDVHGNMLAPYKTISYSFVLDVLKGNRNYWFRARGRLPAGEVDDQPTDAHETSVLSETSMHQYIRMLMTIPSIVSEIQKNLSHLK